MQSYGCFFCLNTEMQKFFNCQAQQGPKHKTTQKKTCKVSCGSLPYIGNKARLRGIKKETVNVDNYADGVASIHLTAIVGKH